VTALSLSSSPTTLHHLLTGDDSGQVSLFDTRISDEQDSLLQGLTHGPIHKAGFLGSHSTDAFFALSSDQQLTLQPVFDESRGDQEEAKPIIVGDLRPLVPCEYVVDVLSGGVVGEGAEAWIVGGWHSKGQVDLVPLGSGGALEGGKRIVLLGGHGTEVVRSIFVDQQVCDFCGRQTCMTDEICRARSSIRLVKMAMCRRFERVRRRARPSLRSIRRVRSQDTSHTETAR
jgi:WD repeat-containing protein 89